MICVTKEWNPKQKQLALLLSKENSFNDAISLCLAMHSQVHDIETGKELSIYQRLVKDLSSEMITYRPENKFSSIAWNLWHITRIEDAIVNILISNGNQIMNAALLNKMHVKVTDTGNAFSREDVDKFDSKIKIGELLQYRKVVGKNTQKILKTLTLKDRKRKPTKEQLDRILSEGVLNQEKDSIWLLDFWGKKTVTGLLAMPITRHQIVHINDCYRLKEIFIKCYVK
jgi:hypothetical protein